MCWDAEDTTPEERQRYLDKRRNNSMASETPVQSCFVGKNMPLIGSNRAIILANPKYARNVSSVVRLASGYGFEQVWYTGDRVSLTDPSKNLDAKCGKNGKKGLNKARLPREERMKGYQKVQIIQNDKPFDLFPKGVVPVAIELTKGAQMLHQFEHPENVVYVFGPEDGSVPPQYMAHCHHRVFIPVQHCLNLATACASVLWDRKLKRLQQGLDPDLSMDEILSDDRAALKYSFGGEMDEELVSTG